MGTITTADIISDPRAFLQRVAAGEVLVVLRDEERFAEIRPLVVSAVELRPFGLCAGQFTVLRDFDAPLPDDILSAFEGQ